MDDKFYSITSMGKRHASSISPRNRNPILDKLKELKVATSVEQMSAMTGIDRHLVLRELKRLERIGLVREAGRGFS